MGKLAIFSTDKSNNKFTLQAAGIPSVVQSYPVRVTATLENGTKITATKDVTIKVTPTIMVDGEPTFVAKNGVGTSHYTFTYTPEKYNVDVNVVSVISNNSKIVVSNVSTTGFDLSTTDITEDASATITMSLSVDGKLQVITMVVKATYKEDSGPFILYNVGESATVSIKRNATTAPMTKMYFKVIEDYVEGEEYDDSAIEYEVWENTSSGSKTVATVGNGQALLLKAYEKIRWSIGNVAYAFFILGNNGKFKAYGKIGALDGYYDKLAAYCYYGMFRGCTGLTQAPELPATTLAAYCYYQMFYGCTGLTQAPELPATTLAAYCYYSMFGNCTGLTSIPEGLLPATTLAERCYLYMFGNCTGLTSIPEGLLPATTLKDDCYYQMFYGCTGLTQAPELPATTLATSCYYQMFYGCTGLTQAPELPATTLATSCYNSMFQGCTGLTQAPELPATTLVDTCYYQMFRGCTKLNYVKALFTTTPGSNYTASWLHKVASSGTFVKNPDATWSVTGADGVPSGWTIVDAV